MRYDVKNLNIWKNSDNRRNRLSRCRVKEIRGAGFTVPVYMGEQLLNADIESLNLSVRSYNCLRKAGWNTVGDVLNSIDCWDDLEKIKNLGKNSRIEIRDRIIFYQKTLLTEAEYAAYASRVRELNKLG